MGLAHPVPQQPVAAEGEQVAGGGVVDREGAGEGAEDDQPLEGGHRPGADVLPGRGVEQLEGRGARGELDGLGGAVGADRHPRDEGVEDSDADDRDERGLRDDPLGVLGLFAVDRGRLEADPRPEGHEQAEADHAARDVVRAEGGERVDRVPDDAVGAASLEEHGEGGAGEDGELEDEHETEDLGRHGDVEVGQPGDRDQGDRGVHGPAELEAELRGERLVGEDGEDADEARLHGHVGEHRHHAGGEPRDA